MAFPTLTPSTRNYASGDYPVKTFRSQSGSESRILYGNRRTGMTLDLQYENVTDTNAELFLAHYDETKGTYTAFELPTDVLTGWSGAPFTLGPSFNVNRNTTATYVDANGIIRTAAAGELRFTYDENGNSTGILVEKESTNLLYPSVPLPLPSQWLARFGNATTQPDVIDPSGENNAIFFESDGTQSFAELTREFNASGLTTLAVSFFARVDSINNPTNRVVVAIYSNVAAGEIVNLGNTQFNFFGNVNTTPRTAYSNYRREYYGNDWYRFSFIANGVFSARSRFDFDTSIPLDPTVWGVQVEPGSEVTSYIPTTTAPATRAADTVSVVGSWRYEGPPQITNVRPGVSSVQVKLIGVL